MFDELYDNFREQYPSFKYFESKDWVYSEKHRVDTKENLASCPVTTLKQIENSSTQPQIIQIEESKQSEDMSQEANDEAEGEGDDQQINVIVEERSNDFSNRKYIEKQTPLKLEESEDQVTYTKQTPKSILCSQRILSDMKSEWGYDEEDIKATMNCLRHKINNLESELSDNGDQDPAKIIDLDPSEREIIVDDSYCDKGPQDISMVESQKVDNLETKPEENTSKDVQMEEDVQQEVEQLESPHFETEKDIKQEQCSSPNLDSKEDKTRSDTNEEEIYQNSIAYRSSKQVEVTSETQSKYEVKSVTNNSEVQSVSSKKQTQLILNSKPSFGFSKPLDKAYKRSKDNRRMDIGLRFLSTPRRRSKVTATKKRDKKYEQKLKQDLVPEQVRMNIQENFKKLKQTKLDLSFEEPKFVPPTKTGLGSRRAQMLLNKENVPS